MIDEFFVLAASNLSVANNGHRNIQYLLRSVGKKAHSRKYHKFRMQTYWFWLSSKQRQQQACKLANYPYRVELWTVKLSDPPPPSQSRPLITSSLAGWACHKTPRRSAPCACLCLWSLCLCLLMPALRVCPSPLTCAAVGWCLAKLLRNASPNKTTSYHLLQQRWGSRALIKASSVHLQKAA